jgi:hypothetical protein
MGLIFKGHVGCSADLASMTTLATINSLGQRKTPCSIASIMSSNHETRAVGMRSSSLGVYAQEPLADFLGTV